MPYIKIIQITCSIRKGREIFATLWTKSGETSKQASSRIFFFLTLASAVVNKVNHSERKTYCASLALFAGAGNNASCNGLQWLERAADCNKVREDVARLIYLHLSKHFFFGISLLRKQVSPYLLRGSLAYIFSGLLIWTQYVKREGKMSLRTKISCTPRENEGFRSRL